MSTAAAADEWAGFKDASSAAPAAESFDDFKDASSESSPAVPKERKRDTGFSTGSTTLDSALGLGELGLQGITGLGTLIAKGTAGAAGMLEHGRKGNAQTVEDIKNAPDMTYQPRTRGARQVNRVLNKAMQGLEDAAVMRGSEGPLPIQQRGSMAPPTAGAESPAASEAMGALLDLGPQAALAVTPARGLGRVVDATMKAPYRYFSPTVQAGNVLRRVGGPLANRQAQAAALRGGGDLDVMADVPNSGRTAAQNLTETPEGTPIQALQQAVSSSPVKGVSADFAKRLAAQKELLEAAKSDRESFTEPFRTRALANASATGGVDAAPLLQSLDAQARTPTVAGTPVAQKVVSAARKIIEDNTDAHGKISPEVVYQLRKTGLGQIVSEAAGQDLNAAKYAQVHVAKGIQNAIDNGITAAGGGKDWATYLKEYSDRSAPIDALEEQTATMYSPEQRTAIGGETGMKDAVQAPHVLSTKAVVANYGLGLRKAVMGNSVTRRIADALLDPQQLADILDPQKRQGGLSPVFRNGPPAPGPREARFGPNLELSPPPGRAFAPHQRPLNRLGERGVPLSESTQNPRTSLSLESPPGTAFDANQPSILRSGEDMPVAERGGLPPSLSLTAPEGTAFEPHNEAVTSSRPQGGPRTAPQWELNMPKPHYSAAEVADILKKLRSGT